MHQAALGVRHQAASNTETEPPKTEKTFHYVSDVRSFESVVLESEPTGLAAHSTREDSRRLRVVELSRSRSIERESNAN